MDYTRHTFEQPLYGPVNVYRVGDTLVDTGHLAPASRDAVAAALDGGPLAGVERVLLTHPHCDHVGGSQTIPELAALPHVVPEGVPDILANYDDYFRRVHAQVRERTAGVPVDTDAILETYFPRGDYAESAIRIDRTLADGDTVRLGTSDCEVLSTPGHSAQHVALWHEPSGTCWSADLVSTNGHFLWGPLYSDVGAYLDSLRRLREYEPDSLVPGHGPMMDDAVDRIEAAIETAEQAIRDLRGAIADADDGIRAETLAREVFDATGAAVWFLTLVACAYLDYLEAEGFVRGHTDDDGVVAESV